MMMMLLAISQLILKGGLLRLRGMVEDGDRGEGLGREGNGPQVSSFMVSVC